MQSAGNELPKRARLQSILRQSPIVAVITIDDVEDAVPLARALVAGGVTALELTLRTSAGLAAAAAILREVPEAVVGIGTILTPDDLAKALQSGAHFGVSPGITAALLDAAAQSDLPFMPGIQSASELMEALVRGFDIVKLFPAAALGRAGDPRSRRTIPRGSLLPDRRRRRGQFHGVAGAAQRGGGRRLVAGIEERHPRGQLGVDHGPRPPRHGQGRRRQARLILHRSRGYGFQSAKQVIAAMAATT